MIPPDTATPAPRRSPTRLIRAITAAAAIAAITHTPPSGQWGAGALAAASPTPTTLAAARAGALGHPPTPDTDPDTRPDPLQAADPDVEDLIRGLERAAGDRRVVRPVQPDRTEQVTPITEAAPTQRTVVPEGTFLPSRRGRMVRAHTGEWIFVFDADARGESEPPMVLVPCRTLMQMERIAEHRGEAATFTVSGQVFVYHNRNYLLPTMFTTRRTIDGITPIQ